MSPPLLGIEVQSQCNVTLMTSSASLDCISQNGTVLKERNYFGLSDNSSVDSSSISSVPQNKNNLNLKATELRLGLPGSQAPEQDSDFTLLPSGNLDEKQLFPLVPSKEGTCLFSGSKRGFSDTINVMLPNKSSGTQLSIKTEEPDKSSQECNDKMNGSNTNTLPAAKSQVVGWPPVRSFRKNTLPTKPNDEVDGKPGPGPLFVKVSMSGAPYLRKVDLRSCSTYLQLSNALEKLFSCFTLGQCGPQRGPIKEMVSESNSRDDLLLHGSDYVLSYEDKDGDWMLVGDVPWEMFITSCKRLKIMKGSDAIGLAPRAVEKSKNKN